MLQIFFFLVSFLVHASHALSAPAPELPLGPTSIVLAPGHFLEIPAPMGVHVTLANGSIASVSDRGRSIRVTGKKIGSTELHVGSALIQVNVVNDATMILYSNLKAAVDSGRGLTVGLENKVIWVRGRLLRWDDWSRLGDIARESTAEYRFGAEIETGIRTRVRRELSGLLRRASLPEISLQTEPTAIATVPLTPEELPKRVQQMLKPFGFSVDASSSALSLEPLVRVRIVVAEIIKTKSLQYGITWPSSLRAQILPNFGFAPDGLGVDLNALEEKGVGRVLASPTLLCRSGKEASFVAGGEIPIKIISFSKNDVIWKQYGVILKIKPLADYSGKMSIALETEVSALDRVGAVDGIPSVHTNRIVSHFDLVRSKTIALSGLIKSDQNESSGGLPGLARLPILGSLFSSKNFIDKKTELVVFVTPDIAPEGSGDESS